MLRTANVEVPDDGDRRRGDGRGAGMARVVAAEHQGAAGQADGDQLEQGDVDDFAFQALHGIFFKTTDGMIWEFF
jgi:hypothetical protein